MKYIPAGIVLNIKIIVCKRPYTKTPLRDAPGEFILKTVPAVAFLLIEGGKNALDKKDYPGAMNNLEEKTRDKAIEIANKLVEDGYEDGRAIPIAISQAKEWYNNRGQSVSDSITHHLKPEGNQWVVESVSGKDSWSFDTKEDAMEKVKSLSRNQSSKIMIHDQHGKFQKVY